MLCRKSLSGYGNGKENIPQTGKRGETAGGRPRFTLHNGALYQYGECAVPDTVRAIWDARQGTFYQSSGVRSNIPGGKNRPRCSGICDQTDIVLRTIPCFGCEL